MMISSLRYGLALGAFVAALSGVAAAEPIRHPTAIFAGLDKTTGRIINFDVAIDETVQFGSLNVTPRVCNTRPQTEAPQTTSFVEVDEVASRLERQAKAELKDARADAKPETRQEAKRIFSGWMFAASPGLHGVEHPVYDVWLVDCKGGKENAPAPVAAEETAPSIDGAAAPAPETGRKKRSRKVEPKAPTPVENAPIGPSDSVPPQPAMDGAPAPDAGAAEAPAQQPQPQKKKKRRSAPAATPVEPQPGGLLPF
jgi:Uncharacterized protein conserved in bacteria, COG4765